MDHSNTRLALQIEKDAGMEQNLFINVYVDALVEILNTFDKIQRYVIRRSSKSSAGLQKVKNSVPCLALIKAISCLPSHKISRDVLFLFIFLKSIIMEKPFCWWKATSHFQPIMCLVLDIEKRKFS